MSGRCTSCGEPLRWARTPDGKSMPLNREPDPTGIIVLEDDGSLRVLSTEAASAARHAGRLTYTSHFATCAHAAEHRRQREICSECGYRVHAPHATCQGGSRADVR